MRAVVTVVGKDMVGILAKVSNSIAKCNANVIEVNQSIVKEFFAMIMIVNIEQLNCSLNDMEDLVKKEVPDMKIYVMHEDIFNSMHQI